jgi:acetate kinase
LRILAVNTGSSSLKAALYQDAGTGDVQLRASMERIGEPHPAFRLTDGGGQTLLERSDGLATHGAAMIALLDWLTERPDMAPDAVGHRVVHGGRRYREPVLVEPEVLAHLYELTSLDPDHLPRAVDVIGRTTERLPGVPQVACFDTAFHRTMPRRARITSLPRELAQEGIVRYGFHGLSYEYIVSELRRSHPGLAAGRVVIAHLGSGASMVAVRDGNSLDTTMGFTPTGGLVMGTRSGDLDPGTIVQLLRLQGLDADQLDDVVNRRAGLLGVSGRSADMRELLSAADSDEDAAAAVELFCYQAGKFLAAMMVASGGAETIVFTGGIGERSAVIRRRICDLVTFLGARLDVERNDAAETVISEAGSPIVMLVIPTNEELVVARHTQRLVRDVFGASQPAAPPPTSPGG